MVCNEGYDLRGGTGKVICKYESRSRAWRWVADGKCVRMQCPDLRPEERMFDNGKGFVRKIGGELRYACNMGFTLTVSIFISSTYYNYYYYYLELSLFGGFR